MPPPQAQAPIPAHVITGPLGAGKTTLIARLLADKPPLENWVVLLNEYSEAGIDALTVAAAARGAYDVRLVPGGCLCCTGEQDFRRNLQRLVGAVRPARLLVEPSGIGHPAGIVEELLAFESAGQLRLEGVVSLVDPARLGAALEGSDPLLRDQIDIGDALVLTKADLADESHLEAFASLVARASPVKAWFGTSVGGVLPRAALEAGRAAGRTAASTTSRSADPVAPRVRPADHVHGEHRDLDGADAVSIVGGERRALRHLGRAGASWWFGPAVCFDEARVVGLLGPAVRGFARFKAVLRVAEDRWLLAQHEGGPLTLRESSWRRDSRAELIAREGQQVHWPALDAVFTAAQRAGP
jgi:G3E family GTPase